MKLVIVGAVIVAGMALSACQKSSVSAADGTVQVAAGNGNTHTLRVGSGDSTVVVGDVQQSQDGIGRNDTVNISAGDGRQANVSINADGSVTVNSASREGRSFSQHAGHAELTRDGVGSISADEN